MNSYFVGITDPFSDTLVALGLQRLLVDLLEKQGSPIDSIQLIHCGGYIRLDLDEPIHDETVNALNEENYMMGGLRFIATAKNKSSLPEDLSSIYIDDYEQIKEENARFYEAIRSGLSGDVLPPKPTNWDVLRTINPAALSGWINVLSAWWKLRNSQAMIIRLILDLYSQLPNPVDEATAYWKKINKENGWNVGELATCQQFFNPDQGKGQNKAKADAVSVGNMKGFWLVEFLKMVGFYHDAITKTVAGGKDRKILIISPRNIRFGDYNAILSSFKSSVTSEASIRFDILATLRYTQILLDHFYEREDLIAKMLGLNIQQNLVGGFHTAFYLDLGNAVATMNLSSIALPGWISIQSNEDFNDYNDILKELITFTRQFEEKNSDAFTLLQHLRDFISGDDLEAFFRLTNAFPAYYIGMRERNKYAKQLTTTTIERIIRMTASKLAPILESEGFQNIAYAIRQSTIVPQYRKASGKRLYDIRYGLGQDLIRVARKGKEVEFIAALFEFLHLYNAENVRIYETRNTQYRRNISTDDLHAITELIDQYDAQTVARMLVAYGYAKVSRSESPEDALPDETLSDADDSFNEE